MPGVSQIEALLESVSLLELPVRARLKDCANCLYRQAGWRDGGHCYIFRDEPQNNLCANFQRGVAVGQKLDVVG